MTSIEKALRERICQGDILRDVECVERVYEDEGILEVSSILFPYIIVLTQDCDLSEDHKLRNAELGAKAYKDKLLVSVLVAPLYNAEQFFNGEHLSELEQKAEAYTRGATNHKYLMQNQRPRYHYLDLSEERGVVSAVIDFKHYFSVHVEYLRRIKNDNYVCSVSPLFREQISHRFAFFLSRIGLPAEPIG